MWNVLILLIMLGLGGYYSMLDQQSLLSSEQARTAGMAVGMAIYREAVIAYCQQHPGLINASVALSALQSSTPSSLPAWYDTASPQRWSNYIDANGTIYIYALKSPPANIVSDIVNLSKNSILVGRFHTGDTTLQSPIFGETNIPLLPPPAGSASIPDGSPIWLASSN